MDLRDENFISLPSLEIIYIELYIFIYNYININIYNYILKLYIFRFFSFLIDAKKIILFVESHVELRITKHRFEIVYRK